MLLGDILNFRVIMNVTADQADNFVLILFDQQIKSARIAFLSTFNKLLVCFPSAHSHAPPARTACAEPHSY